MTWPKESTAPLGCGVPGRRVLIIRLDVTDVCELSALSIKHAVAELIVYKGNGSSGVEATVIDSWIEEPTEGVS